MAKFAKVWEGSKELKMGSRVLKKDTHHRNMIVSYSFYSSNDVLYMCFTYFLNIFSMNDGSQVETDHSFWCRPEGFEQYMKDRGVDVSKDPAQDICLPQR